MYGMKKLGILFVGHIAQPDDEVYLTKVLKISWKILQWFLPIFEG